MGCFFVFFFVFDASVLVPLCSLKGWQIFIFMYLLFVWRRDGVFSMSTSVRLALFLALYIKRQEVPSGAAVPEVHSKKQQISLAQ